MSYTIQEVSKITGLPASTLRYYESVSIISPINRDNSSKHRKYSEKDVELIESIACLNAVNIPIKEIKHYLENLEEGMDAAAKQVKLFAEHKQRLEDEMRAIKTRYDYVSIKLDFWKAVADSNKEKANKLLAKSKELSKSLISQNPE